ncbi:MAG: efflux RND transporter permease subunit [Desulfobacterales bacterium]|nr:efflux RND transporter permease subunit [Desulfobacterales bacterium]
MKDQEAGIVSSIVKYFLTSNFSIMLALISLCLGVAAILATPKEEEPQIVVPMADVYVSAPGAMPEEIEKLVTTSLEQILWEIDGVEYVYSMSMRGRAVITVRFFVGEDRENSLVKLHNKIQMNIDRVPPIVSEWVVKPVEIDDVSIVNLTLYSDRYNDHELRRIGEEVSTRLSRLEDISRSSIIGGRKREVRVELDPERMKGFKVTAMDITKALKGADVSVNAGTIDKGNQEIALTSSSFLMSVDEVKSLVVGGGHFRPVFLDDVANVIDGPEETASYTRIGFSNQVLKDIQMDHLQGKHFPAVSIALSKKKGTNAVKVSNAILNAMEKMKDTLIPDSVYVHVTRNYGKTSQDKVNGLLGSLGFAIVSVVILLAIALGWREAVIVALAVPVSFSLALFVNYIFGYTINRVTLFALILSLGLVVDDPITNVDNIQRHIRQGILEPFNATLYAINEVLPPVIMSTIAIIVCFTPLFFITGMMGPYMAPMAVNVPLTVTFSTLCALTIVPWISFKLLKKPKVRTKSLKKSKVSLSKIYKFVLVPFLENPKYRKFLFFTIGFLLLGSCSLVLFKLVPLKLLPFDNKNEFQIVIDMPEGTTLEHTNRVVMLFEDYLQKVSEVTDVTSYTGISSPMDFNGMVRHYFMRQGSHLADIRINLADKALRKQQSHAILLRLRKDLEKIAYENQADIQLVEVPPGPPVLSTIVIEISGSAEKTYQELLDGAEYIKDILKNEPFVTDIKIVNEKDKARIDFEVDREKAALHGIETAQILSTLDTAVKGVTPATVHLGTQRNPLWVKVILPREKRSDISAICQLPIRSSTGHMISLAELVNLKEKPYRKQIYHKNLEPVVYVLGEVAGRAPGEAVLHMQKVLKNNPLPSGIHAQWAGEGEWKITLRVFRDMGIAFGAALIGTYLILVVFTKSYFMPALIMMAIPLTILGIMPGFFILNLFTQDVGGFSNPVFFTATSMIGMIALGGIVIRNSLVLIEFIQDSVSQGDKLKDAILKSGAVRMRPIVLTALTTAIGAFPIIFDPVFSGLAWALIFGLFASTLFTLIVIPLAYYVIYKKAYE